MHRIRAVESISAVRCCSVYVRNSEKQRYIMNKYILILLLSALALINVQAASKSSENKSKSKDSTENHVSSGTNIDTNDDDSHDSENNTTISIDDDNDSSVNTDDGNNKNNTSVNTDNDNGKNNTNINTGDDNNKNNTSVNTGNDNGKNDTYSGTNNGTIPDEDVEHDIRIITECMIRSTSIGNLVTHIIRLTKIVFVVVPSLRNPIINYYYVIFKFACNRLIELNIWLQYLEAIIRNFLESSVLFP